MGHVESECYLRRKTCGRARNLAATESRLGANGGTTASDARVSRAVRWWYDGSWWCPCNWKWHVESECYMRRKACGRARNLAATESRLGTNGGTTAGHARVPKSVWNDVGF